MNGKALFKEILCNEKPITLYSGGGVLLATLLLVACPSNVPTESGSTSESGEQQSSTETQTLENAKSDLTIQTVVTQGQDTISLPISISGFDDVTITWSSDNSSIITINQNNDSCNGIVAHQNGDGSDTVNLTATLSYNGKTTTKSFTMTVYQENAELSKQEILEAAAAKLSITYDGTTYGWQNVNLQTSVTVEDKNVDVSWDTVSTDSHLTLSGNTMSVIRDIADIPLSLKATLSYDGESYETTVPFTLTHIPEFIFTETQTYYSDNGPYNVTKTYSYIFDGSVFKYSKEYETDYYGNDYDGYMYSYTTDTTAKTITVTMVKYYKNDKWYTKEELQNYYLQECSEYYNNYKSVASNPTIENYCLLSVCTEEQAYKELYYDGCFPEGVTEETVASQSEEVKKDAVRRYVEKRIERWRKNYGLSQSATESEIIDKVFQNDKKEVMEDINNDFRTIIYDYIVDFNPKFNPWKEELSENERWQNNISFSAEASWLPGKHWYEQNFATDSGWFNSGCALDYDVVDSKVLGYKKGEFYWNENNNYFGGRVLFNDDFTSFALEPREDDESIAEENKVWTIVEDLVNKKITISNGHGKTKDLYFRPLRRLD